jgi:cysteinyl-tRNA synthetase
LKASALLIGLDLGREYRRTVDQVVGEIVVDQLIAERAVAKKNRDFVTADRIRNELKADGIILEDGPNGTTWRRE